MQRSDPSARMLLGVDGSAPSDASVMFALALAQEAHAPVRFIAVFERDKLIAECSANPYAATELGATLEVAESGMRAYLDGALKAAAAAGIDATGTLREGEAADTILAEARACEASCIALGTHARRGLARMFLGSTAEAVLRHSECPVLVTSAAAKSSVTKRVLCALDDSPAAHSAFESALAYVLARDAELHLLAVVSIDDLYAQHFELEGFDPDGSLSAIYAEPRALVKRFAAEAATAGARVAAHVHGGSNVAERILRAANRYECGLVAIGTHGRSGISRLVLGSTAEAVVRAGTLPVLAMHDARTSRQTAGTPHVLQHTGSAAT